MEIQKSLLNYTNSSRTNFNEKCPDTPKCSDIIRFCTTLLKIYNPVHFVINTFTLGQQTIDSFSLQQNHYFFDKITLISVKDLNCFCTLVSRNLLDNT